MSDTLELLLSEPALVPSHPSDSRSVQRRWQLSEPVTDDAGDTSFQALTLRCTHSASRKRFRADLSLSTIKDSKGFSTERFWLFGSNVIVLTEPVGRYSARAMDAFVARALAAARTQDQADAVDRLRAKRDAFNA